MFKTIQKYLLVNHPLLWNTKIVPLTTIMIILNIVFFALGYHNGAINFSESNNNYISNASEPIITFIGILISIIILIIWLVLYFKNNSFKSFYPKNSFSLFKEWIIIFVSIFMIGMVAISYLYAKDLRVRNYFSEIEAKNRCETLSLASIFLQGSFETKYHDAINNLGDTIQVENNFSEFRNKRYATNSLMNKNIGSFQFFDKNIDSINTKKVRDWLFDNQKEKVKTLLENYLVIANEHHLKGNVDANQWLDLVYNYPNFTEINIVGNDPRVDAYYGDTTQAVSVAAVDTAAVNAPIVDNFDYTNKYKKEIDGFDVEFFKHYVPASNLNFAYAKIADAWVSPDITWISLLFPLYFALGISLLIFSFRVTSGKNWLIAIVALGIINIIFGVISAVFGTEIFYLSMLGLLIFGLFVYFIFVSNRKKGKQFSAITLNGLLWLFGGFFPLVYTIFIEFLKWKFDYQYGYEDGMDSTLLMNKNKEMFDFIDLLKDNYTIVMVINSVFIFLFMIFITYKIKNWKGISEN